MKKIVKTAMLTSVLGLAVTPIITSANEVEGDYPTATTARTTSVINFMEDTDPGLPVDPTDPEKPIIPIDPINPAKGDFILTYAPTLDFGEQKPTETSWQAKGILLEDGTTKVAPFASIKDTRGGDRKGWALQASLADDFKNEAGKKLEGAAITFSKFVVASGINNAPQVPEAAVTLSTTPSDLATASATTGAGNWSIGFGELDEATQTTNGVQLTVPQTAVKDKGSYATTINWELLSEPTI